MAGTKKKPTDEAVLKRVADIIAEEVSYFNGWTVSPEQVDQDCNTAAKRIWHYLRRAGRL